MSRNDPTELLVALHVDTPKAAAVLVSIDGEHARGAWIPRRLIESMHQTGKTTRGTDRDGQRVNLPLLNLVIPEWLAIREGLV
jgi:hypothetical protein